MPFNTDDKLPPIIVRGASITKEVQEKVESLTVSMTAPEASEMTVVVSDEGLKLFSQGIFKAKTPVDIQDLKLSIVNFDVGGGNTGLGQITMHLQPRLIQALRDRRGANILNNVSSSTYVQIGVEKAGGTAVVQGTTKRPQVARDVNVVGQGGKTDDNNEWTTYQRLAQEEGFFLFECLNVVYYGKPTWLVNKLPVMKVLWANEPGKSDDQCQGVPDCSEDVTTQKKTVTVVLPLRRSREARTGKVMQLEGMPQFSGKYLITDVSFPAAGSGTVSVTGESPVDPDPQPATDKGSK